MATAIRRIRKRRERREHILYYAAMVRCFLKDIWWAVFPLLIGVGVAIGAQRMQEMSLPPYQLARSETLIIEKPETLYEISVRVLDDHPDMKQWFTYDTYAEEELYPRLGKKLYLSKKEFKEYVREHTLVSGTKISIPIYKER